VAADADPNRPDVEVGDRPDADPNRPDSTVIQLPPDAAPDDANVAAACTLVPQSGCPGEACDLDDAMLATGGTVCRPVTAMGMDTSTCAGVTTCAAGWTCLGASATESQCYEFCATDSQCAPATGGLCVINIVYGTPPMEVPGVTVCSKACDPLDGSGCPSTWGCHVYQEEPPGTRFFSHCAPSGPGGQNAACVDDTDCQQNYSCVNTGMSNVCLKNCNVTTNTGCAGIAGTACTGFTNHPVVGGAEYGVCF
jgi:hypothetical protein